MKLNLLYIGIIFIFYIFLGSCSNSEKLDRVNRENKVLKDSILSLNLRIYQCDKLNKSNQLAMDSVNDLKYRIDTLLSAINYFEAVSNYFASAKSYWFSEYDRNYLKEQGIQNPEVYLYKSLLSDEKMQQKIASYGSLGGRMGLYEYPFLIGHNTLLAEGEDGHTILYFLFHYEITDNKRVKWSLICTFSDD